MLITSSQRPLPPKRTPDSELVRRVEFWLDRAELYHGDPELRDKCLEYANFWLKELDGRHG